MNVLPEAITSRLRREDIRSIIHVGAGRTIDPFYASFGADRIVLIEGDEQSVKLLRNQTAKAANVEVIHAVLAADGQATCVWHCSSLPSLSGLVDPASWRSFYPRITSTVREDVPTSSFPELLDSLATDGRCLLVMDVPGLEETLLSQLSSAAMERVDWIVVSYAGPAWRESDRSSVVEMLVSGDHEMLVSDAESEPLWTTTLLRLDRIRSGARHSARAALFESELSTAKELGERLKATVHAHESRIAALCQEVDEIRAARQHLLESVAHEAHVSADLRSQLIASAERLEALSSTARQVQRLLAETIVRAWHDQREAERGAYQAACNAHATHSNDRTRPVQAASDEAKKDHVHEVTARLEGARHLSTLRDSADRESTSRQRRYEDEMVKVYAQIELIKDVLLRDEDL